MYKVILHNMAADEWKIMEFHKMSDFISFVIMDGYVKNSFRVKGGKVIFQRKVNGRRVTYTANEMKKAPPQAAGFE